MKVMFLDDSKQRDCPRDGVSDLVGVGGVIVPGDQLGNLEAALKQACDDFGFPQDAVFKWSPRRGDWMRENLVGERRTEFFNVALNACADHGCKFVVAVVDTSCRHATQNAQDHETDALNLALERFNTHMRDEDGIVFVAKPSGGQRDEGRLLADCVELLDTGTGYVEFENIAMNVVTVPFKLSRTLQCSDLVVAISTSMVAGRAAYADNHFAIITEGALRDWRGFVGGTGVKIHPQTIYVNLHHWLLGEDYSARFNCPLPIPGRPYSEASDRR